MAADTETLRQVAQARAPFSAWLGIVLLFVLFGAIVLAVIGPSPRGDNYEQKRAKAREEKLKAMRGDDAKALTTYSWIDKNKGTARIPVERAMELNMADLKAKKPAPAGPIASPVPPAAATSPTPAAAASASPSVTPKPTSVTGPNSEARAQPTGAINPAPASPGTQPGASASPAASAPAPAARPAASPTALPILPPPGSPVPVRGKETPTPAPH